MRAEIEELRQKERQDEEKLASTMPRADSEHEDHSQNSEGSLLSAWPREDSGKRMGLTALLHGVRSWLQGPAPVENRGKSRCCKQEAALSG